MPNRKENPEVLGKVCSLLNLNPEAIQSVVYMDSKKTKKIHVVADLDGKSIDFFRDLGTSDFLNFMEYMKGVAQNGTLASSSAS